MTNERRRYRQSLFGKLILQIEVQTPYNYDPVKDNAPGGYFGKWRDAKISDLTVKESK